MREERARAPRRRRRFVALEQNTTFDNPQARAAASRHRGGATKGKRIKSACESGSISRRNRPTVCR